MAKDSGNPLSDFSSLISTGIDAFFGNAKTRGMMASRIQLSQQAYGLMLKFWNEIISYLQETEKEAPAFEENDPGGEIFLEFREGLEKVFEKFQLGQSYNDYGLLERFQLSIGKQLHRGVAGTTSYQREIQFELEKLWDRFWALKRTEEEFISRPRVNSLIENYLSLWKSEADSFLPPEEESDGLWIADEILESARKLEGKIQQDLLQHGGSKVNRFSTSGDLLTREALKKIASKLKDKLPERILPKFREALNLASQEIDFYEDGRLHIALIRYPLIIEGMNVKEEVLWRGKEKPDVFWNELTQEQYQEALGELDNQIDEDIFSLFWEKWREEVERDYDFRILGEDEKEMLRNIGVDDDLASKEMADGIVDEILDPGQNEITTKLIGSWIRLFHSRVTQRKTIIIPLLEELNNALSNWYEKMPGLFRHPTEFSYIFSRFLIEKSKSQLTAAYTQNMLQFLGNWFQSQINHGKAANNFFYFAEPVLEDFGMQLFPYNSINPNEVRPDPDGYHLVRDPQVMYLLKSHFQWSSEPSASPPVLSGEKLAKTRDFFRKFVEDLEEGKGLFDQFVHEKKEAGNSFPYPQTNELLDILSASGEISDIFYLTSLAKLYMRAYYQFQDGTLRFRNLLESLYNDLPKDRRTDSFFSVDKDTALADFDREIQGILRKGRIHYNPMEILSVLWNAVNIYEVALEGDPFENLDLPELTDEKESAENSDSTEGEGSPDAEEEEWDFAGEDFLFETSSPGPAFWEPESKLFRYFNPEECVLFMIHSYFVHELEKHILRHIEFRSNLLDQSWEILYPEIAKIFKVEYESLVYQYAPGYLSDSAYDANISYDLSTFNGVFATFERSVKEVFEKRYRAGN